jgi:hypothetical protein
VRVADGTAAIVTGDERVRLRTGPAATPPLPGAEPDGEGWLAELPRGETQAALATLLSAEIEVREVRPIVSVPLFELSPALSPSAWTADALLNGGAIGGPAIALAVHAAALVALAGAALKRVP